MLPALVNAILCGHNIILLGERGQGKSRIIRSMIDFLDAEMPAVAGCPIHDSPFNPICSECKQKLKDMGDQLPVDYIPREKRLIEKLATSDVSTADLIGEVDPIKVAQGRTLDDESSIHCRWIPLLWPLPSRKTTPAGDASSRPSKTASMSRYARTIPWTENMDAAATLVDPANPAEASAAIEFILEGLHLSNKLNREEIEDRLVYK